MEDDKKGEHLPGKSGLPKDNFRKLDAHTCRPHVNFSPYLPDGYIPEQNKEVCNEVEKIWTMNLTEIEPRLIGPYVITAQSIRCINSLLPDEVIDSFIYEMVCRRANDGIYHLNCIAMTAIFEGEEEIHHCLRRLPSLLTFDMIIGAYNQGHCHWCLIFLKARFDAGLESELLDTWKIDTPKHSKQFDSTSCGVFVLKFAENYLEGRSLDFTWNALDVEKARLSLAVFLLSVSQPRLSVEDEPNVKPDTVIEQEAEDEMEEHDSQEGTDKETFSQKKVYNFRQQKPKRKRSSFLYWSPKKMQRKHYCICKKPDDGRKYWCCDGCNKWFHPTCVGKTYEEEEETFFCPSCEGDNCKDNFTEVKHRVSSDDEVGSHSYSKRISGKTALEVYPQVVGHLEEVVSCSDSNCEEKDHKRHHEFCANPLQVVAKQKKKFAFGRYYFAHTTMEELTDKLASDLLYKVPDRKNPVTSLESTMVRYVPKRSFLWKLFTYHKQLAFQYIIYVLRKELLILTAALYYSSPYEKCEKDCMSTEMDSKALFGI